VGSSRRVYLVRHRELSKLLVLKEAVTDVQSAKHQHQQEVLILKSLSFPGIPELYEYGENENICYIVQEYVSGKSLHSILMQFISQEQFIKYSHQMIIIVQKLHQHLRGPILYLDFKSEHFLVRDEIVYLLDFGLAEFAPSGQLENIEYGTEEFSAPETRQRRIATVASDVYSLGILLKKMFEKTRFDDLEVKSRIQSILNRMTKEDLAERSPNLSEAEEVLKELRYQAKENQKSLLNKKVAVLGSQPRVGTTFVSALLTGCLNRLGVPACYKEDPKKRWIVGSSLLKEGRFTESEYWRGCFRATPDYGPFVKSGERKPHSVNTVDICDLGVYRPEKGLENYSLIILVLGARAWEQRMSEEQYLALKGRKNCILVCSLQTRDEVKDLSRILGKEVYLIPAMESPYQSEKRIQKLILQINGLLHSEKS